MRRPRSIPSTDHRTSAYVVLRSILVASQVLRRVVRRLRRQSQAQLVIAVQSEPLVLQEDEGSRQLGFYNTHQISHLPNLHSNNKKVHFQQNNATARSARARAIGELTEQT